MKTIAFIPARCGSKSIYLKNIKEFCGKPLIYWSIEALEKAMEIAAFQMLEIPKEALFLAGKAFMQYKKSEGSKSSPLPDFYIGAQAAVMDLDLITRDESRYRTYFPTVNLITP